ncbi:MAG: bifunctional oligoribonuclease/PAP phosphatase NrnA [Bacillota bacterium]|nr:bifunctional oligoribonuclease/PAP phosphatase NrnA [Bacillota bacterium]
MYNWSEIVNCINSYNDIVILTHTNMDGDAMGSASALCHALRSLNKNAVILLEDSVPRYLNILNHHLGNDNEYPYFVSEMPFDAKLAIAVDCGDESRIEKRLDVFKKAEKRICIDHHIQTAPFADYTIVDPDLAATGLLIYKLIKELGAKIDTHIAEDLYVAIVTDTGRFKYSNTTAEVHQVVSELYEYNIDHVKLCNAIYDSYPMEQLKAEALAQEKMQLFANGKAVISNITIDEMNSIGVGYDQIDTCIDRIRIVEGVEVAAFLKEKEPSVIKVSFRAKSYADVNRVATALGGGGHEKASGATLNFKQLNLLKTQ